MDRNNGQNDCWQDTTTPTVPAFASYTSTLVAHPSISIRVVQPSEIVTRPRVLDEITDVINAVYLHASDGLWATNSARTSLEEVKSFIETGEMIVAVKSDDSEGNDEDDGEDDDPTNVEERRRRQRQKTKRENPAVIVGAVRLGFRSAHVADFGMLAVLDEYKGLGIGNALLSFIEAVALEKGARRIQLEILVPQKWKHPSKEFLKGWYARKGYAFLEKDDIGRRHPKLVDQLVAECDFVVYEKTLLGREEEAGGNIDGAPPRCISELKLVSSTTS
ncbi:hypothetical protein PV08_06371 [Exophiala spinifera]|uniref:N-acetyltransferase domain-containing protein n=1 Tax=Exophiala spinifera TaxID=91928 RepID=A0A0D2BCG6_9EURO|nr:uncharacterized protein PV08_06371 [Exophiala spinifera]KIW16320.1 hypothetical protein PV08_06371 [Exophiala spinifera]